MVFISLGSPECPTYCCIPACSFSVSKAAKFATNNGALISGSGMPCMSCSSPYTAADRLSIVCRTLNKINHSSYGTVIFSTLCGPIRALHTRLLDYRLSLSRTFARRMHAMQ
ncbi:nwd2 [Moniliophthora roreri]|nr:nwd2 [Moniliophthora roreri]